jgi:DNA-binding response OmpR family regulator
VPESASAPVPVRPGRVLSIEDDAAVRQFVRAVLQADGFEVQEAADGPSGLAALRADPPDVVLLDLIMPYASGFDVLRSMQEDPRTRDIPVLVLSCQGGEEEIVRALADGAEDFLIKPFYARELVARVRKVLTRTRATRD